MNLLMGLAIALLVQPVVEQDTAVRLVASDTDGHPVQWVMDGRVLGNTSGSEALALTLPPGSHNIWARSDYEGEWRALVRPVHATAMEGVQYVSGWSALHPAANPPTPWWPPVLAFVGVVVLLWAGRGPKRP